MRLLRDPMTWGLVFGAFILASIASLPKAHGELVFEDQADSPAAAEQDNRTSERTTTRQTLEASEKAKTTLQAPAVVTVQNPAPFQIQAQSQTQATPEVQNLSKTELMRRERMRE